MSKPFYSQEYTQKNQKWVFKQKLIYDYTQRHYSQQPKVETTQMPMNRKMHRQDVVIHAMDIFLIIFLTYTHIHSFSDPFAIQIITEYWGEFPVLYSRSLLASHSVYHIVYMPVLNPQSIPPPPSPLVNISLFSKSVSLLLFCK